MLTFFDDFAIAQENRCWSSLDINSDMSLEPSLDVTTRSIYDIL